MQPYITLDEIKKHLTLDEWSDVDDAYLEQLIDENVKQAIMLLVGTFYNNREATSELTYKEVPLAYQYLLQQLKNYRY